MVFTYLGSYNNTIEWSNCMISTKNQENSNVVDIHDLVFYMWCKKYKKKYKKSHFACFGLWKYKYWKEHEF